MNSAPAVRLAVGYAAVAATIPYLALKAMWLSGGTVGLNNPLFFSENPEYVFGNLLTVVMDGVAVLIALALTHGWGLRLPAWVVLFPMWVATGFLVPIVVIVPFAPAAFGDASAGPLRGWVYLFVYGGFAAQGLLLSTAFALYARARWGRVLASRNGDAGLKVPHFARTLPTVSAALLAAAAGLLHLAWALGAEVGLPDAVVSDLPVAYRLTNGVYAAFAFACAAGLPMLVYGWPRRARLWGPLALAWAGAGSLLAWGLWQTATMAASPELGSPLLAVVMPAKVLAAVLAGATAVRLLRGCHGPSRSHGGDSRPRREDREAIPGESRTPRRGA